MRTRVIVALLIAIGISGCGGGSSPIPPTAPGPPAVPTIVASGANWSFRLDGFTGAPANTIARGGLIIVATYGSSQPLVALEGAFNSLAGSVTAVLQPFGRCFSWDVNRVRFTGTRSGDSIVLESQPNEGQVVRLNLTMTPGGDVAQGTYTITGGCGAGATGPISGRRIDITGVWAGKMAAIDTVFDIAMAGAPDADGNFNISGTARFSGTSCFANATITRRGRGRVFFPDVAGAPHHMELIAEVWDDPSTMQIEFALTQGVCPELVRGNGRLDRRN